MSDKDRPPSVYKLQLALAAERKYHTKTRKELLRLKGLLHTIAAQTDPAWGQRLAREESGYVPPEDIFFNPSE